MTMETPISMNQHLHFVNGLEGTSSESCASDVGRNRPRLHNASSEYPKKMEVSSRDNHGNMEKYGGAIHGGNPRMIYNGKSQLQMDDDWG